jgi:ubiquinone/menaquinone biosynthesis C-methylase UbiE
MDRSLHEIGRLLLERAAIRPGERVIDVGCGSGATTLAAAPLVGAQGSVLGVDVSEPMLAVARRRAAGLGNVRFVAADAQTHAFEPGAQDLVLSRFGVMFFDDPPRAFASLRRALRPGGRLCFVCWGRSRTIRGSASR